GVNPREIDGGAEESGRALLGQQPLKLAFHRLGDSIPVARREAVQYELFNMQLNIHWLHTRLHIHPAISVSVSGFPILSYSLRAARSRCDMVTGSSLSAARKAPCSAMLRILPPVMLSRASFAISKFSVGVSRGKMRRQISARCVASGNGNWMTKRKRRRKAGSSAAFKLVVRMARPR